MSVFKHSIPPGIVVLGLLKNFLLPENLERKKKQNSQMATNRKV